MKAKLEQDVLVGCQGRFADHSQTRATSVRPIPYALDLTEAGLGLPINKNL
jgi:hypothetical protein